MSFMSKVELKKQLQVMGIKIKGNYVRKSDVEKILAGNDEAGFNKYVSNLEKKFIPYLKRKGLHDLVEDANKLLVYLTGDMRAKGLSDFIEHIDNDIVPSISDPEISKQFDLGSYYLSEPF